MQPQEKLFKWGPGELNDEEILSLILRTGGPFGKKGEYVSVRRFAKRLIRDFDGLESMLSLQPNVLLKAKGIGLGKAAQLCAIGEWVRRAPQRKQPKPAGAIRGSQDAFRYLKVLAEESQEVMMAIFLTVRNEMLGKKIIFRGSVESAVASPREILREALLFNAARIIVGHNHPSHRCDPSPDDIDFTAKLALAGEALGIPLLDHLVIGDCENYYSFADASASQLFGSGKRLAKRYRTQLPMHPFPCLESSSSHPTGSTQ